MSKTQSVTESAKQSSWGPVAVPTGDHVVHRVGPLGLVLKKVSNEIWIATDRTQLELPDTDALVWSRWALKKESTPLEVMPMMPDRQVVVRPEYPFMLAPGAEVRIYTRIPVWVGVFALEGKRHMLMETPTVIMCKTWFGDFTEGTMCYWISTTARRVITDDVFQSHTAISTLQIRNESSADLKIDKLGIRVDRLSLFDKDGQLWTDEMDIRYKGEEQHSEITMKGKPPSEVKEAKLLTSPRDPVKKSFAERTFRILKDIPGFN